jgi:hypothetical protein
MHVGSELGSFCWENGQDRRGFVEPGSGLHAWAHTGRTFVVSSLDAQVLRLHVLVLA